MNTCKWCGKQFDYNSFSRGSRSTAYCCGRCYNAAMREEQRKRKETEQFWAELKQKRNDRRQRKDEIRKQGGLGVKLLMIWDIIKWSAIILAIIFLVYFIYSHRSSLKANSSNQRNEIRTETVQQSVNVKQTVDEGLFKETIEENDDSNPIVESLDVPDTQPIPPDNEFELSEEDVDGVKETLDNIDEVVIEENNDITTELQDYSRQRVFDIVDETPVFPGGNQELSRYIAENLIYPQEAIENRTQGRVFVQFIVEPDGSVSNANVIRGIGSGCDEEAIRVVESLSGFTPGKKNGTVVRALYTVPVVFSIQ